MICAWPRYGDGDNGDGGTATEDDRRGRMGDTEYAEYRAEQAVKYAVSKWATLELESTQSEASEHTSQQQDDREEMEEVRRAATAAAEAGGA